MAQMKAKNPALERLRAISSGQGGRTQEGATAHGGADQPALPAASEVVSLHRPAPAAPAAAPAAAPEPPQATAATLAPASEPPRPTADLLRPDAPNAQNGPGRPPVDTTQISLRLPRKWEAILRRRAAEVSLKAGRTVTPQQVILQLIGATMPRSEGGNLDG